MKYVIAGFCGFNAALGWGLAHWEVWMAFWFSFGLVVLFAWDRLPSLDPVTISEQFWAARQHDGQRNTASAKSATGSLAGANSPACRTAQPRHDAPPVHFFSGKTNQ